MRLDPHESANRLPQSDRGGFPGNLRRILAAMRLIHPGRSSSSESASAKSRVARRIERLIAGPVLRRVVLDPVLSWGWRRYMRDGRTPRVAYRAMRTAFLTPSTSTWGRLAERASRERPLLTFIAQPTGLVEGIHADVLATLRRDGLVVLPTLLPSGLCDELAACARSATCTLVDPPDGGAARAQFDPSALRSIRYDIPEEDLLTSMTVQCLLADESLLRLAQDYLGAAPVQDLVAGWWSAPGPGSASRAAQMFHFDLDRPRFLKLFVYVTDVGPETGPHAFVRGTHRRLPIQFRADRRYSDAAVLSRFHGDIVRLWGSRGTVFLADTRGLHKGEPVLNGHRLVIQLEWASSLFGNSYARPTLRARDASLADAMRRFPTVYQRFMVASRDA